MKTGYLGLRRMMTGEACGLPVNRGQSEKIFGKLVYLLRGFLHRQALPRLFAAPNRETPVSAFA